MPLKDFDAVDLKIMAELDRDSRQSYSQLGRKLRIAKETVKYRVEKLLENRAIENFYAVINFSKIGFTLYRIYISLQNTSPSIEEKMADYLSKSKSVNIFYRVNGHYDIALGIWAKDIWQLQDFWEDFKKNFGQYFLRSHFFIMTDYREFSRGYLTPGKKSDKAIFNAVQHSKPEKLDETDFRLLSLLSNNSRMPIIELSRKLSLSVATVRHRMKSLNGRKVIIAFRTAFNLAALGREYYKVDLWFTKFDKADEIASFILSNPDVTYTEKTLVGGDLEFDVEVENFSKFTELMDSFKAKFPEDIRNYSYYSLVKNCKTSYVPSF